MATTPTPTTDPKPLIRAAELIFPLPQGTYLFFRRDNAPGIPYPGRIALIGGRCDEDEPAE